MTGRKAELERTKAKLQALREQNAQFRRKREHDIDSPQYRSFSGQNEINRTLSDHGRSSAAKEMVSFASSLPPVPTQSDQAALLPSPQSSESSNQLTAQLSVMNVQEINIFPKKVETYSKGNQTDGVSADINDWMKEEDDKDFPQHSSLNCKLPPGILPRGLPHVTDVQPEVVPGDSKLPQRLSEEEKQRIIHSENFQHFLDRSSHIVERAISEIDILIDYSATIKEKDVQPDLSLNQCFFDEHWSCNRVVTSLDWSEQFSELLVASYHRNWDFPTKSEGTCLVWNARSKRTTPEHIFRCHSPVLSATFARFHPNLIIGGTYSGQIVLWDMRVPKQTPVQQTRLSVNAHSHPLHSMHVVGTQNLRTLISISSDGRWCSWSLDMLTDPLKSVELLTKGGIRVRPTALAFTSDDNNFVVGSEEGHVYAGYRQGSDAKITETYKGHSAFVTGVSSHAADLSDSTVFSSLFLTSSMDWTVKLWNFHKNEILHSFEDNHDCVYDVAWSPIHPALFASVDGTGRLDVWNLNMDVGTSAANITVSGCPALSRVRWTPGGMHVSVGDDMGKIWLYNVGETLALPHHDEWAKFADTLQEMKANIHLDI